MEKNVLTAEEFMNAVNTFTGQADFDLPLVNLPGRNGLNLAISAHYGGPVWKAASTWNLDAPTGVLGLGWSLSVPRIFAVFGQSAAPEATAYFLAWRDPVQQLWCTGGSGDVWTFGTKGNDPWKITYDRGRALWTIIDEDGVTHVFGDPLSGRSTVANNTRWGNWIGASGSLPSQQTFVSAWLLNSSANRFGDSILYSYSAIQQPVAGPQGQTFTQSMVLLRAVASDGSQAVFSYGIKQPAEYQAPHTNPSPPNAWQDSLNTQFLDHIDVSSISGALLYTLQFSYAADLLGPANFEKRLLTGVQQVAPSGGALPSVQFSYCGQTSTDNVSPAQPFNAQTKSLYGSIKSVTLMEGGSVGFAYAQTQALQYASRTYTVTAPVSGATQPQFYFEDNYLVGTWLDSANNCQVTVYTWNGRWISQLLAAVPVGGATGYAAVQVVTSPSCFGVWGGGQLHLFYQDPMNIGLWISANAGKSQPYYTPTFGGGESTMLAVGQGFAGLLGLASGTLYRYRWLGTAWTQDAAITLAAGRLTLAAHDSMLVALAAASSQMPATVWLYRRDMAGNWQSGQSTVNLGSLFPNAIALVMGGTFAACMGSKTLGATQQLQYAAFWWSADLQSVSSLVFPQQQITAGAIPAPPLVADDVIAVDQTLYRFDGLQWHEFDLGAITYPNESSASLSVGADVAVRRITVTGGGPTIYELSVYDPNTAVWKTITSSQSSALLPAAAACGRDSISNYAISAGALQYRQPSGAWISGQTLTGTFSSADLATVQLLGSEYLIYQQGTGTPLVQTSLYLLENGGVTAATPITRAGEQIAIAGDTRNMLVGRRAFITYTGIFGASGSVLKLYRPVNLDAVNPQTAYVVTTVTANNGYSDVAGYVSQLQNGFLYTSDGATVTADGLSPLFNLAQQIPGSDGATTPNGKTSVYRFNGLLAPAEQPVLAYPTGSQTNIAQNVSVASGMPYTHQALASDGVMIVSSTVLYQWAFVTPLGATGAAARIRTQQITSLLDGVPSTTVNTFDANTGLITKTSRSNLNELGQDQQFNQSFEYFWQVYDPSRALNLLTPVIQIISQTVNSTLNTATTTAIVVQTFRENWGYGAGQWAPDRSFTALSAAAPAFNSWSVNDPAPDPNLWRKTAQVLARTAQGMTLDSIDVLNRHFIAAFDVQGRYPVVSAFNAPGAADTLSWYGCEPYEPFGPWISSAPGETIADYLTAADFHTGTRCLALPPMPSSSQGPMAILQPGDQTRQYVFSCWARAANGFNAGQGTASATIAFFNPATGQPVPAVPNIVVTLTPASAPSPITQWTFYPVLIDLPQLVIASGLPSLGITITLTNANQGTVCYVDELRFMPVDCRFSSLVYDPANFLVTGQVDSNGQARQMRYTEFLLPFLKLGPLGRVDEVLDFAFSRSLTTSGAFVPELPNRSIRLTSNLASRYYDFHDGTLTDFAYTDKDNWHMTNGQLVYGGTGAGPVGATAQILLYQPANFAVRVAVLQTGAGVSVALGDGIYFMRWNAGATQWELVQIVNNAATLLKSSKVIGSPIGSWTFGVVDGFVIAHVNGVELFSYQYTPPTIIQPGYGKATLGATGQAAFDDLVLLDSPQINFSFSDGLGKRMQGLGLFGFLPQGGPLAGGSICQGLGCFYDSMNRVFAMREPLTANLVFQSQDNQGTQPAQLLNGLPTSYLTDSSGNVLSLNQYLQGQGGYTFTAFTYEPAPTSRPLTRIAPRAQQADPAAFTTTLSYSASNTPVPPAPGQTVAGTLNYSVTVRTRPYTRNGQGQTVMIDEISSRDQIGKLLVHLEGSRGGAYQSTAYLYDDAGRVTQIRQPNYFAPPNGSSPGTWVIAKTYTYLGLLQSQSTPDQGQTQMIYDSANRLRFTMDANGAALTPQQIQYVKYDNLDRVVETGYIQDANVSWGAALQQKADVEQFPVISAVPGGNNAQGSWLKKMQYDIGASGNLLYQLGRLYQAAINQNASSAQPDTETYGYDAYGNVVSKSVNMASLAGASYTTAFAYNNQDQQLQVVYPAIDNSPPTLKFSYDRLGRLAAVGFPDPNDGVVDPSNPPPAPSQRFAVYQYDANGRLASATLNTAVGVSAFTRALTYNDNGWLTGIADPYFNETLGYGPGADGLNYLNGQVASTSIQYSPNANWPAAPLPYNTNFSYDGYQRLTAASVSGHDGWSLNVPANGYDANGNLQKRVQGQTSTSYTYKSGGQPAVQISDQVTSLSSTVQNSVNFDLVPPSQKSASGWSWGSNNGGPSGSQTTTAQHPSGLTQSLELTGGALGHYEVLSLNTYLPPSATITLVCQVKTGTGYGQSTGGAAWYAILYRAQGPTVSVPISVINTSTDWQSLSIPIALATISGAYGGSVVQIGLELRNQGRTAQGSTGPSIFIAALSLTGAATAPAYQYDNDGNTVQAMSRSLFSISYNPVNGRTTSIQFGSAAGNLLKFSYGLDDYRTLKTYQTSGATPLVLGQVLTLTGLNGRPLAEHLSSGPDSVVRYYIPGVTGIVAVIESGQPKFLLGDHLGSQRLLVDGATGNVENTFDYVPFGGLIRANANPEVPRMFTGQELDQETGLYDFHARLYDPALGRFYGTDPAGEGDSPYAYVGNNPINATDPTGMWRRWAVAGAVVVAGGAIGIGLQGEGYDKIIRSLIFKSRRNLAELNAIPRDDLSTWEWIYNAPAWFYLPFLPISPTELFVIVRSQGSRTIEAITAIRMLNQRTRDFRRDLLGIDFVKKNALRHAYWTSLLANSFGEDLALALSDAHEYAHKDLTIEGPFDHVTDKINNLIGIKMAKTIGDSGAVLESWWNVGLLASAMNFRVDQHTGRQIADINYQKPLDWLWNQTGHVPTFDALELATLKRLGVNIPG